LSESSAQTKKKLFDWHSNGKHLSVGVIGNSYMMKSEVEASSEVESGSH